MIYLENSNNWKKTQLKELVNNFIEYANKHDINGCATTLVNSQKLIRSMTDIYYEEILPILSEMVNKLNSLETSIQDSIKETIKKRRENNTESDRAKRIYIKRN